MKKLIFTIISLALPLIASAQTPIVDWARTDRYAAERAAFTESPKAVFIGDSITECWSVDMDFFNSNNYFEAGVSGHTTAQTLCRFRTDVINLHPKYVVILIGTNDIAENIGPVEKEVVIGNIQSMVQLAKANKIKPIICSITPVTVFSWRPNIAPTEKVMDYNEALKALAKSEKVPYVDYHSALRTPDGKLREEYSKDGCHLTLEAYKVMESIIVPYLK